MTDKPRNLLMIHLESVSRIILWQYRAELETVWSFMPRSLWFENYHACSTSTEMAISDIMFGDSSVRDHCAHFKGVKGRPLTRIDKYFRYKAQYESLVCGYSGVLSAPSDSGHSYWTPDLQDYCRRIEKFMRSAGETKTPFFLYLSNGISHMAFDCGSKARSQTFSERFRNGYLELDASIRFALNKLKEQGMWEETVIVFFGDHGDELWSHGLNKGYCHAFAPYASLVRVPLFIYDNDSNIGMQWELCSSIDLMRMLLPMIFPDEKTRVPLSTGMFSGRNAIQDRKDFVFAQNLYALQLENDDIEKGLSKGYSVADKCYRLVVSTGGRNPNDGGMELFHDGLDPANMFNILTLFELDNNGDIVGTHMPKGDLHPNLAAFFLPETLEGLKRRFQALKAELMAYVKAKEYRAMGLNNGERHVVPDRVFKQVRKAIRID